MFNTFLEGIRSGMRNLGVMLPRDLIFLIRTGFLGGLTLVTGLPRTLSHYLLAAFLWDHIGPVVLL